ncbi:MAG: hypothetical protein R2796_12350 [Chitinophagaceae bacterium]
MKSKSETLSYHAVDYGFWNGVFDFHFGFIFLFQKQAGNISLNEKFPPDNVDKLFGAICLLYGGWRIYRGFKKNILKKDEPFHQL